MTVREVIERLQKLDQDKGIWVCYDGGYSWFAPLPDDEAEQDFRDGKIKKGDYIITAG